MRFPIEQIWIDEDAIQYPLTGKILAKLPQAEVCRGGVLTERMSLLNLEPDPISKGKRILRLMKHKGTFIKPCPGTPEYVCCGLQILHIGQGCPMDCRYCALQGYFNRPVLEAFVNVDDLFRDLERSLTTNRRFHRVCTGEFTDSLALDPLTELAPLLVDFFSRHANASLEIKTKTDFIEPLLGLNPKGRVVVAFSVNAEVIARNEERKAASLHRRIRAASRVCDAGYRVAFHLDPIIPIPDWEQAYGKTIDAIFSEVDASAIVWISLGVLRFVPELKQVAMERFGPVSYFHEAFLRGLDGKSRLYVDRRVAMYRFLSGRIRELGPSVRLYLCMESPYVWERALNLRMPGDEALSRYLDEAMT
jgi:spore photoproduct lyase